MDVVVMRTEDVTWNGRTFRRHPDHPDRHRRVYYMATTAPRNYLHREVYVAAHGPIPAGMDVHHVDHDPLNNNPANLRAMPASAHAQYHYSTRVSLTYICLHCGCLFASRKATRNIRWCSPRCKQAARREAGLVPSKPSVAMPPLAYVCAECGRESASAKPWAIYCSAVCRGRSGRRRRRVAA